MPWPMVHFSIAYSMFNGQPNRDFLLGSIAPDAVQFRNDKSSKARSHLYAGSYSDWSELIKFYNTNINLYPGNAYRMFLLGYLSHIMADDLWVTYKRELAGQDKHILKAIWNEENQYDLNLSRSAPWRNAVKTHVTSASLYELTDLYSLDELDRWRRELFIWLETPENEPFIEIHYLKEANAASYIDEIASIIHDWMKTKLEAI